MPAQVQRQNTTLEEMTRHAAAGLAMRTDDPDVQVNSMKYFYMHTYGHDPHDPVIGMNGSMYKNKEQLKSVIDYFGQEKYIGALAKATIGEIITNAAQFGYTAPASVKRALAPYMTKKYTDIIAVIMAGKEADEWIKEAGGENAFATRLNELAPLLQARKKAEEYQPILESLNQIEGVKLKGRVQSKVLETMATYYLNDLAKKIK